MAKKQNFATVEKLREAIITLHKQQPNAVVLVNPNVVDEFDKIAQEERQTVLMVMKKGRRQKVEAIAYEGELHYFEESDSKKRFLFYLQQ